MKTTKVKKTQKTRKSSNDFSSDEIIDETTTKDFFEVDLDAEVEEETLTIEDYWQFLKVHNRRT